ncbi:hypothetical protein BC938DRAFT_482349 [Jimgerdemannia flammicorona]|uniref:Uncharacterized protein n=1 Tax=Jimgerdemannia flammicorona TaxID=994334 RepID=A0A433QWI9_9FUNG|nr:hypothetical protein BC938DRAFT_482349 [Jimgerdemannia flammicorona]
MNCVFFAIAFAALNSVNAVPDNLGLNTTQPLNLKLKTAITEVQGQALLKYKVIIRNAPSPLCAINLPHIHRDNRGEIRNRVHAGERSACQLYHEPSQKRHGKNLPSGGRSNRTANLRRSSLASTTRIPVSAQLIGGFPANIVSASLGDLGIESVEDPAKYLQ